MSGSETTSHLSIPLLFSNQAQKEITVNEALCRIDALLNAGAISRSVATPPVSPAAGDLYLVAASPTGVWSGHANHLAYYDQIWRFIVPNEGLTLWVNNEDRLFSYNGTAWVQTAGDAGAITQLGVNATADSTNRLSVKSPAVLFDHNGTDSRVKVSKAATANTASHLFQTNYSSRAEFGLTGDDNFHVKVSPDGTNWYEALVVDRSSGTVTPGQPAKTRVAFNVLRGIVQPETQTIIEAMSVVPARKRTFLIDDLVTALKVAGVWSKLDILYLMAAHDAQAARLNWIDPTKYALVAHNSPPFTANSGYAGDGVAAYLATGFIPATHATKMATNSAHIGVWVTSMDASLTADFGSRLNTDANQTKIRLRTGNDLLYINNLGVASGAVSEAPGHVLIKAEADGATYYVNGTPSSLIAGTPTTLTTQELYLKRTGDVYTARGSAVAHAGAALSNGEATALYSALQAYMAGL